MRGTCPRIHDVLATGPVAQAVHTTDRLTITLSPCPLITRRRTQTTVNAPPRAPIHSDSSVAKEWFVARRADCPHRCACIPRCESSRPFAAYVCSMSEGRRDVHCEAQRRQDSVLSPAQCCRHSSSDGHRHRASPLVLRKAVSAISQKGAIARQPLSGSAAWAARMVLG